MGGAEAPAGRAGAPGPAFLGVERSATGRRWQGPPPERDRAARALAQATGLAEPVARLLARQGVAAEGAAAYLAPKLRDLMPDPSTLRDLDRAAAALVAAARGGGRIAVFSDYDVDGAASAALLLRWLRALGREATLYIPDRIAEGYGPNAPAMAALGAAHDLVVCLDCGTLAHGPLAAARAGGAEVLVIDHHLGAEALPPAAAVVNPNRADEAGGLGHLCAAGVLLLVLAAANRLLRAAGAAPPDLLAHLDLVALATVADVAPLAGLNRAFVRQGLAVLAQRAKPGLAALADVAKAAPPFTAHHLGFVLGPRVNAGGRVGAADLGARLLLTDDPAEAVRLAARLDALNRQRQEIEAAVLDAARADAEARGTDGPLVWAAGEGWHPGVVGIVAARLREQFDRPALVFALEGATGRGSGRGVSGVDLGSAVHRLAAEGLALAGGGHAMAAGLTVARDALGPAMDRLATLLARAGAGEGGAPVLALDGLLAPGALTPATVAEIEAAGPFGAGAPAPRWALAGLHVREARPVGTGHLRLALADAAGARVEAMAFRALPGPLGALLSDPARAPLHVAGRIEADAWGGRPRARLLIEDAAPAR